MTTLRETCEEDERERESTVSEILECILDKKAEFPEKTNITETVYESVLDRMIEGHEWLDLYMQKEEPAEGEEEKRQDSTFYKRRLVEFKDFFYELYPDDTDDQVTNVLLYVLNNPENNLKQRTVAEHICMNSTLLSASFTDKTHMSFINYLANVRLYRAAFLLAYSNLKIAEVSKRLSYKDAAYFSRIFKKKFHLNPSEFRGKYNTRIV
jgi:YesN/AraC family two-component response regulator